MSPRTLKHSHKLSILAPIWWYVVKVLSYNMFGRVKEKGVRVFLLQNAYRTQQNTVPTQKVVLTFCFRETQTTRKSNQVTF